MKSNLKIVFFGTPSFIEPVINKLKKNFLVVSEVRNRDDYEAVKDSFEAMNPDLFVVAAFGKIIPQNILDIPKYGSLNIHPSLLPKFRGPSPIQAAILAGNDKSGVSIIKMDAQMDHGPILAQGELEITPNETFESFAIKAFEEGSQMLTDVIPQFISGELSTIVQNDEEATFCKLVKKEDGYFEIDNPPNLEILSRMIRAYHPWPGVWTKWNEKIVKFLPSSPVILSEAKDIYSSQPKTDQNGSGGGFLVQMEGKRATDLKSFLNGYPDFPIKSL